MTEMKLFNNSEFGILEVITINGKEYFPATECAKILGYGNPRDAIVKHCKEDGVVFCDGVSETVNQYGKVTQQNVQKKYINEGNLYRLITHSKLPAAEKFESWIFDEVIPEIRQTGAYALNTYQNKDIAQIVQQAVSSAVSETIKQLIPAITQVIGYTVSQNRSTDNIPTVTEQYENKPYKVKVGIDEVMFTPGKIEGFPREIRSEVDRTLIDMKENQSVNFSAIARFCTANGYKISYMGVKSYYYRHFK